MVKDDVEGIMYLREVQTEKTLTFRAYNTAQKAIDDRDPRLKVQLYRADMTLLGEIQWTLVPLGQGPEDRQAVSAIVIPGKAVDAPDQKKS